MESVTVKNFVCILSAKSIQKQLKIESFREKTKKAIEIKTLIALNLLEPTSGIEPLAC